MHDVNNTIFDVNNVKFDVQPCNFGLQDTIFDPDSSVDDVPFPKFDVLGYCQKKSLSEFDFQKGFLNDINRIILSVV